jgi:hypothetical protein
VPTGADRVGRDTQIFKATRGGPHILWSQTKHGKHGPNREQQHPVYQQHPVRRTPLGSR